MALTYGVTARRFEEIVESVIARIEAADDFERAAFVGTSRDRLGTYHHGFGTWIRNTYGLWENPWEPVIEDGCDVSPDHPDNISGRIIEAVHDRMTDRDGG